MSRRMVIPGELVAEGEYRLGGGVYKEGNHIYSAILGTLDERKGFIRTIPLAGKYMPKVGDFVIGMIQDVQRSGWSVDINSAYTGILNASDYLMDVDPFQTDLSTILPLGEMIYAKIREITHSKKIYITMDERGARRLKRGRLVEITPIKIPRAIGKKGSMLSMIRELSNCRITVGQNGWILIDGNQKMTDLVVKALKRIEREAHKSGLTVAIKEMITEERELL